MSRIMAAIYDRFLAKTEEAGLRAWRSELLAGLSGEVLEVGTGTGLNLEHYPSVVARLVLAEPDPFMRRKLGEKVAQSGRLGVEVVDAPLEALPFADNTFDYVACTLVLCSVSDPARSIAEIYRVLKPGGALVYIEHVAAANNPKRAVWQRRIEPLWKRMMGNCHLTRKTAEQLTNGGFVFEGTKAESMRAALPIVRPTIRGLARKPAVA